MSKKALLFFTVLFSLLFYASAAWAQAPADPTWQDLLMPIYLAIRAGRFDYAVVLGVIAATTLGRRHLGRWIPWFGSAQGGAFLALVLTMATTVASALGTEGARITWTLIKDAFWYGVGIAGLYSVVKAFVVDPYIRPLAAKAPDWAKPIFAALLYWFDSHTPTPAEVVRKAERAGVDAVISKPGGGVIAVVGTPKEVE